MTIQKNEFYENQKIKILRICKEYTHMCANCPYGDELTQSCLFCKQIEREEK